MELALQAVEYAAALLSENRTRDPRTVARVLATARPSMAVIANAVALFIAPLVDERYSRDAIHAHAHTLIEGWTRETDALRSHALSHIPKAILAYSNSSSTRTTLIAAKNQIERVIIPEGRPIDDGKRLATILAAAGIPVTVVTEGQMGWWVPQVEAVIVGADTVAPDGAISNHMGTATLALVAHLHHIPMYSLTHTLKIAPYDRSEDVREENDPAEVWAHPPLGVIVRNVTFDRTPADHVRIITEQGMMNAEQIAVAVAKHRAAWETVGLAGYFEEQEQRNDGTTRDHDSLV